MCGQGSFSCSDLKPHKEVCAVKACMVDLVNRSLDSVPPLGTFMRDLGWSRHSEDGLARITCACVHAHRIMCTLRVHCALFFLVLQESLTVRETS